MRKYSAFALLAMTAMLSCKKTGVNCEGNVNPGKLTSHQIDAFIKEKFEADHRFEWKSASDQMIWSALPGKRPRAFSGIYACRYVC